MHLCCMQGLDPENRPEVVKSLPKKVFEAGRSHARGGSKLGCGELKKEKIRRTKKADVYPAGRKTAGEKTESERRRWWPCLNGLPGKRRILKQLSRPSSSRRGKREIKFTGGDRVSRNTQGVRAAVGWRGGKTPF